MLSDIVILGIYFTIIVPIIFWGYDFKSNNFQTRKGGKPTLINHFRSVYSLRWIKYLSTQCKYEYSKHWDSKYPFFDDNPNFPRSN